MKKFMLGVGLICGLGLAQPAEADIIYLKSKDHKLAKAVRGSVQAGESGQLVITKEDGSTMIVKVSDVVSIRRDAATRPHGAGGSAKPAKTDNTKPEKAATPAKNTDEDRGSSSSPSKPSDTAKADNASRIQPAANNAGTPAGAAKPQSASGVMPHRKGATWTRDFGEGEISEEVIAVSKDGQDTTYSMKRQNSDGSTDHWKVIRAVENGKVVWKEQQPRSVATTFFVEPATIGTTWKDGEGNTWKVTSLSETYTDKGGKKHFNCIRVDQINAQGAKREGRQKIWAVGVGQVNGGLKSFKR